jgi:YHS domain-containing protein
MKKFSIAIAIIAVAGAAAWFFFLKEPVFKANEGFLTNVNKEGVIIEGYDPVAYFANGEPVKGKPEFSFHYAGATFWFASKEHRELFKADPKKYVPQYGAFCGYAVSIGKLRPVDPTIYQIENGRLILQHTKEAYDLFNENLKSSITKADQNWPGLVTSHLGRAVHYDEKAPVAAK